jgi:hypothetical protein
MLTDDDGLVHRPFGSSTVETETMPDGRTIRYYSWPPGDGERGRVRADADGAADVDDPADAAGGAEAGGADPPQPSDR